MFENNFSVKKLAKRNYYEKRKFQEEGLKIRCYNCGWEWYWKNKMVKNIIVKEVEKWFLTAKCPRCKVKLRESNKIKIDE
ncbi:hypothetical protein M0R01_04520 [bacterium]|jgi:Zn finger protein HypA/HybF involved in hydrogenase expression|nr:hypothetical protein [bacterium]